MLQYLAICTSPEHYLNEHPVFGSGFGSASRECLVWRWSLQAGGWNFPVLVPSEVEIGLYIAGTWCQKSRINVDVTSWHHIDVDETFNPRHAPAGCNVSSTFYMTLLRRHVSEGYEVASTLFRRHLTAEYHLASTSLSDAFRDKLFYDYKNI